MTDNCFRPLYHFTPLRNWMNDPNGLVWFDGEYHLFFQHNPESTDWGNMSWGHAVSPDLVHWEELPVALRFGEDEHVFSGSVVHDRNNTSGLGGPGQAPLVAVYTSHPPVAGHQTQSLAFSVDRGRTWHRYSGNPVLDIGSADFRDPKVFWYADGGFWVMVVAIAVERVVRLYRSDDLRSWEQLSDFGPAGSTTGVWECPDLFHLPLDDDPDRVRWVLVVSVQDGAPAGGSGMQYFIGDFDGTKFAADNPDDVAWLDHGADYYAAVSFSDVPDGHSLHVAWMSNWAYARVVPAESFRGAMSLPRRYALRTIGGTATLVQQPLTPTWPEPVYTLADVPLRGTRALPATAHGTALRIRLTLDPATAATVGLRVRTGAGQRTEIGYDVASSQLWLDRSRSGRTGFHAGFGAVHRAAYTPGSGVVRLEVFVDTTSVEVFADDGVVVMTDQIFPDATSAGVEVFADGGTAVVCSLDVARPD